MSGYVRAREAPAGQSSAGFEIFRFGTGARHAPWLVPAIGVHLVAVAWFSPVAVFAYLAYGGAALFAYAFVERRLRLEAVWLYWFYASVVIALYLAQRATLPGFYGFSGPPGIGTDDSFFFLQIARDLPHNFPERGWERATHAFSRVLAAVTPWPVRHPFDVLFVNAAVAVLIPVATRRLARAIGLDERGARIAFVLALVCPFVLANSAVLVRDGWSAALFAVGLAFALERRWVPLGAAFGLLVVIRLASALQLAVALGVLAFLWPIARNGAGPAPPAARRLVALGAVVAAGLILAPVAVRFLDAEGLLGVGFFREEFIHAFSERTGTESLLNRVAGFPAPVRIPITFAYFFAGPFLALDRIITDGILVPRNMLVSVYAALFVGYLYFLANGLGRALEARDGRVLAFWACYLVLVLAVSQLSLLIRHKTMLMPLMYVLVATGIVAGRRVSLAGAGAAAALLLVQTAAWWP